MRWAPKLALHVCQSLVFHQVMLECDTVLQGESESLDYTRSRWYTLPCAVLRADAPSTGDRLIPVARIVSPAVAVESLPLGACREPPLLGSARPLSVHTVFSGPRPVISSSLPLCTSCAFPYARRLSRVHRGTSVLCCRAFRSERDQMNPPPEKETANGRRTRAAII